jgi:hypothetical protein
MAPDPHRGPFFHHRVLLTSGDPIVTIARTVQDAISMVEEIWGPGHILTCERDSRPSDGHLLSYSKCCREFMQNQKKLLDIKVAQRGS